MDRVGRQRQTHVANSVHHVMIRGNNRQCIFYSDEDFHYFLKIIREGAEKFDFKIIAYCLMSNHAHLLIHINHSPLSSVMQKINYRYAVWLNHKKQRIGHLFQGRYRSLCVNDESYLVNLCRYIHLNPVTAKMVISADDYPWSSHQYYLVNHHPSWMESNLMLTAIKNKTNCEYNHFIMQPVNRKTWRPAIFISDTGKIVCNDGVLRNLQCQSQCELSLSDPVVFHRLPEDRVINIVCNELNIQQSLLFGLSKNHNISKQRMLLTKYLIEYSGKNICVVSKLFERTHGTFSRQFKKFSEDPEKYFPVAVLKKVEFLLKESMGR